MIIKFRKPTEKDGKEIATWHYDGIYSFYDNDKTKAKQQWTRNIHQEDNTYALYNEEDKLIGHCNFDYGDEGWIFGIQMRPDLTGKGMGTNIVKSILDFGKATYKYNKLSLCVAKFNQRAIRIYDKLGFETVEEFLWDVNGEENVAFIAMRKLYTE